MAKNEEVKVLAFEKKLVPSDGYLYGTKWGSRDEAIPLKLQEKSVRGTISNRQKPAIQNDPAKLNNEIRKSNPQTVDACALGPDQDTLKLHFTLKVLGGILQPSACSNSAFMKTYQTAAKAYIEAHGFEELSKRYAQNIANARFLWRNRVGAEEILVLVKVLNKGEETQWKFDAFQYNLRQFEGADSQVDELAQRIAAALSSADDYLMLDIDCYAKIGKSQEVYPSQEMVMDKGASKKSKVLYDVNGIAALHSQKVGNAIRTIDTWYPEFESPDASTGPIAIEPYGAVTNMGKAYRTPKEKQDFYTLFDSWARGGELKREEDLHYVMAVLVRGGVFG